MTHTPNVEVLLHATDIRSVLQELEKEIGRTTAMMHTLEEVFLEEGLNIKNNVNEILKNGENIALIDCSNTGKSGDNCSKGSILHAEAVITPLKALQKYVEACDVFIHEHIAYARQQVDLAADVSKTYQKMFPEDLLRFSSSTTATAAEVNTSSSTPRMENYTPIGGRICNDDIKHYLSRFVRWEPLEVDLVNYAATGVTDETQRSATLFNNGDGNGAGKTTPFSANAHGILSRPDGSQVASQTFTTEHSTRRSLNAVMDDLLLRQLQYDGIALTTAMEMNLGCYDRMTVGTTVSSLTDVAPCDVAIPQEVRRGIMQPLLDCDMEVDCIQMVQNVYPRTVQWIAKIAGHCGVCGMNSVDVVSLEDVLAILLTPADNSTHMRQTSEVSVGNENSTHSLFLSALASHEHREEEQQEDELMRGVSMWAEETHSDGSPRRRQIPLVRTTNIDEEYTEDEGQVAEAPELLVYQSLREEMQRSRTHYAGGPVDSSTYTDEEEEDEEMDEELGRDDEEDIEEEEEREEVVDERERVCLEEFGIAEHQLQEENQRSKRNALTFTGDKGEKLEVVTIERIKIILSDLVIICALQRLSQMVSHRKDETMSTTIQKAIEFTFSLQRHPLVAWRIAVEKEYQQIKQEDSNEDERKGDTGRPQSLLLTFNHVFVALGYLPVVLGGRQEDQTRQEVQKVGKEASKKEDESSVHCEQEHLLACVAPFLYLWCGYSSNKSDRLVSVDVLCDRDNFEHSTKVLPFIPTCTSPFVWRECVLIDLLDQIHKLRQLETLLVSDGTSLSSTAVAISRPESLLYRLVYPLSRFALRTLDEYCEKGLFVRFDEDQQQQQYTSPPVRRDTSLHSLQQQQQRHPHHPHYHPPQPQQPVTGDSEGMRRVGLNQFRSLLGLARPYRFRRREPPDEEGGNNHGDTNNNNNSSSNANNSNTNASLMQPQTYVLSRGQRQHAITLELPHVCSILLQQDELQRCATPSLLDMRGTTYFYAANPTLVRGSYFAWQPMFQTTMCYCPVTRQRCLDATVCGIEQEGSQEPPLALNSRPGFNSAQLLTCGHVLSNRAIVAMLERSRRQGRAMGTSVQCAYCHGETMLEDLVMLFYIY